MRERIERLGVDEAHAAYGDPVAELRRYEGSVDLLVLGARRPGLGGRAFGRETARQIADEPVCPLLVVPGEKVLRAARG